MNRMPIAGLSVALFLGGCSTVDTSRLPKMPWSSPKVEESAYQAPKRMAAIWSADVLTQVGKPPVRGFGGRFYFYNAENQPIPVEGQLVVYAYDDSAPATTQNRQPDRKFAFTPEQFTEHYSPSALGASYSVWVPWDEAGGDQRNISLLPVFTATSGQIVMGQQALNVLPGRQPELAQQRFAPRTPIARAALPPASAAIQPAGHYQTDTALAQTQAAPPRLSTTTIQLPSTMQRRIAAAGPMETATSANAGNPGAAARTPGSPTHGYPPTMGAAYPSATEYSPAQIPPPGWPPTYQTSSQPVHYEHPTLPAPTGPGEPSGRVGFGWRRHPAAPQFAHPSSPRHPTPTQVQEYGGYGAPAVR